MYELQSPNSQISVRPGNIVKLNRFADESWVVNLGWFSYAGNRPINGWYLVSTAHKDKVKPLNLSDLDDIYVIEAGEVKEDYKELDPKIKKLIHDLKLQVEELQKEVAQLTIEIEAKDEVIAEKGQEILALQKQINDLAAEIAALETQHSLDVETIETLNRQVRAQAEIIAEKAAEIRTLTARVAELAQENELLTQQHQEDLATIAQQSATIQEQAESIATLTTENEALSDENDRLTDENAELVTQHQEDIATIAEQAQTIETKDEQIDGLNSQITTLAAENQEQAETITRQNTTIDQLNSRVPKMYTPPIVTPSGSTQQITPPPAEDYDGLASVTVDRVTAEGIGFNPGYYKEGETCVGKVGTYNPFPYDSDAGIYFIDNNEEGYPETVLVENWDGGNTYLSFATDATKLRRNIRKLIFKNCKDIGNISTSFQTSAFLEEVELSGVEVLSVNSMFSSCPNLRKVSIKDTLEQLGGEYTLATNPLLKEVILPESLLLIGSYCFVRCYALEEITLPENVTGLYQYCFDSCSRLKTINFPKSITLLYTSCFRYCSALEFITVENGFNCDNLDLSASTLYSHDTILSWFNALADRTGQTAYTLTIGTTNLNKMTPEEKAIAINKNWNLN